jgi:hypothetical protein
VTLSASGLPTGGDGLLAATGMVTFKITGTTTVLCSGSVSAGGASCTTGYLGAASYPVTATYGGDTNYLGSSTTTSFTISQAATSFSATADPTSTTYGNTISLAESGLPGGGDGVLAATGTVTFTANGSTLCNVTLGGTASSCLTADLVPGSYSVTASYSGDGNYTGSSTTTSFTIDSAPTTMTASAGPASAAHPNIVTLSASGLPTGGVGVDAATGSVAFTTNGGPLCTGSVTTGGSSCVTGALAAGTYPVTATYSGDSNYAGTTASTSFTITQGGTAFIAAAVPSTTTYGNIVALDATGLPSDATGAVTYSAGAALLCTAGVSDGGADCSTSVLAAGTYDVTAAYSGDQNYVPSSASTTFTITRAATAFSASASPAADVYPAAVDLTGAGLPDNATGTVTFTSGSTTLCAGPAQGGSASCTSTIHPDGQYPVTATYSGDHNYMGSVVSTAFVVNGGYWLVASDGGIFTFGGSRFSGSTEEAGFTTPVKGKVIAMVPTPDGLGYWLLTNEGEVITFGDAQSFGDMFSIDKAGSLAAPIVGIVATPDGRGYWLVGADGGVFTFGDAHFYGNTYTVGVAGSLAAPIVGMAATPDGRGYWLVGGDGGVITFGDAHFYGNTYTIGKESSLAAPIVGISPTADGHGYWLAGADGGLFGFGDAHFLGNSYTDGESASIRDSVVGISASPEGEGYWMVTSAGKVLTFGAARTDGDILTAGLGGGLRGPVVGIVAELLQAVPLSAGAARNIERGR